VAATASAAAAAAAAKAAAITEDYNRAVSLSSTRAAKNASIVEESSGGRAQRARAARQYSKAQRALTEKRVAEAVQNAAGSVAPAAKTTAVIGMLKLRQLLVSGNKLSGSLPVAYSQMQELQVSGDTHIQACAASTNVAVSGCLPVDVNC
jgi:hypothetical protein